MAQLTIRLADDSPALDQIAEAQTAIQKRSGFRPSRAAVAAKALEIGARALVADVPPRAA